MHRVSNKRKHPRYNGAGLWARIKTEGEFAEAQLENISLGGALVSMRWAAPEGKNVLLELRGAQRDLRLVGRVVAIVPKGRGRPNPCARIKFSTSSQRHTDQLFALIRGLPNDDKLAARPTDPEAFEFHEVRFAESGERLMPSETTDGSGEHSASDFDIDVEVEDSRSRIVYTDDEATVPM